MIESVLTFAVYIASFLFVFSIIVVFHELGHFWAARACGMKIDTFSLGFGNTLASWRDRHGTVWRLAALPLGGYVKFFGDAGPSSNPDRDSLAELREEIAREHGEDTVRRCFHFKPVWQRMFVVAAGPVANFILAFSIFTVMILSFGDEGITPRISEVIDGSPAAEAGFEPGDLILEVEGRPIRFFRQLKQYISLSSGDEVEFLVERDGAPTQLYARIVREAQEDAFGNETEMGYLGVRVDPQEAGIISARYGVFGSAARGGELTIEALEAPVRYISRLVTGRESPDQLRGPLGIGQISGDAARQSFDAAANQGGVVAGLSNALVTLLTLAAILSVVMGMLNLLPIPVLDGGHLVYYAYEAVRGRPLGEAAQEWGFRIGLVLVLSLMLFATLNDLRFGGVFDALGSALS